MNNREFESTQILEKTISVLRFPLLVGVVLIHCDLTSKCQLSSGEFGLQVMYFFSQVLCRVCVPIYFLMSGFLFFYKLNGNIDRKIYIKKLDRRIKTLLYPYFLWNLIGFIVLLIKVSLPRFFPGIVGLEVDITTFIDSFWDFRYPEDVASINPYEPAGYPIDFPLWFLRDLIILSIVAPIIYFLIRIFNVFFPLLMVILYIGNIWYYGIVGFDITGFTFFTIGAYFSINKTNPITYLSKLKLLPLIYVLIALADVYTCNESYNIFIHRFGIVIGVVSCIIVFVWLVKNNKISNNKSLSGLGFFIYAFHGLLISIVKGLLVSLIQPKYNVIVLFDYLILLVVIILVSTLCYKLCKMIYPKLLSILIGGK